MRSIEQLRAYQQAAVEFVSTRPRGMLWLDVGLGKTAIMATMLADYFAGCRAYRCLVVATKAIAQHTWQDELEAWEHTHRIPARSLVGVSGKMLAPTMVIDRGARIDTINYERLQTLEAELNKRKLRLSQLYDVVICDEITALKNGTGKRFKAMARMVQHVPFFWGLTGSAGAEGYHQLWAPMYLVDNGYRLGVTQRIFQDTFFTQLGEKLALRAGAKAEIHEILRDVVMVLDARDHGVVPELVIDTRHVHMPESCLSQYQDLEATMIVELNSKLIVAANAGVLLNKCLQYTSGAMYWSPGLPDWHVVHSAKLDALDSLIGELNGEPLIVGVQYKHEAQRILEHCPQAVHMTSANVGDVAPRWNRREIPVLVTHPKSCGPGLNLQHGGHHLCWYTPPWSLEQYEQLIGRIRRPGQQENIVIAHALTMPGTVDDVVWAAVTRKQSVHDALKAAMAA